MRFSRWQTIGILGVTAFLCLAALPTFLSAHVRQGLPDWAQRHVALGYDVAGGVHVLAVVSDGTRGAIPLRRDASMQLIEERVRFAGVEATVRAVGVDGIVFDSPDPALLKRLTAVNF
jgi:preprotein translocase subunit SecD